MALGKGLDGSGGSVSARVGNGENGDGNDGVEDGWESLDTSLLDGEHERRGLGVGTVRAQKIWVVGWEDQAKEEEGDNVEEGNSPEDLSGSLREGLVGLSGFGSGQADHLSTTESEGGDDEDRAEALESVVERTGILPVVETNVATVVSGDTTAVGDDGKDDETHAGADLDDGESSFDLTISSDTEELDGNEEDEEESDPDSHVDVFSPVSDGDGSSNELKRKHNQPRQSVLPADSEAP